MTLFHWPFPVTTVGPGGLSPVWPRRTRHRRWIVCNKTNFRHEAGGSITVTLNSQDMHSLAVAYCTTMTSFRGWFGTTRSRICLLRG